MHIARAILNICICNKLLAYSISSCSPEIVEAAEATIADVCAKDVATSEAAVATV